MGGSSSSELKSCLKSVSDHNKPTPEQLASVWDRYDANKDGDMDSKEMAILMVALTELQKDEVKGNIEEQAKAMGTHAMFVCDSLSSHDLRALHPSAIVVFI
jgi:hypothetical protein